MNNSTVDTPTPYYFNPIGNELTLQQHLGLLKIKSKYQESVYNTSAAYTSYLVGSIRLYWHEVTFYNTKSDGGKTGIEWSIEYSTYFNLSTTQWWHQKNGPIPERVLVILREWYDEIITNN